MTSSRGRLSPGEEESPREDVDWWNKPQGPNASGAREAPGYILNHDSVFSRLHADSAARLEKLTRMQEEARRQHHAYEDQFVHHAWGESEDIQEASERLYGEAKNRRIRQAKRHEDAMYLEELHNNLRDGQRSRSAADLRGGGENHWDKLYSNARQKEARLERARQAKEMSERKYAETHSVHRPGEPKSAEAFSRLYADGLQRDWRREQQRILETEVESQRQAEESVHRNVRSTSQSTLDEAAQRLYNEGKLRQQRLEEQRQRAVKGEVKSRPASTGRVTARIDALYNDAGRRRQDRQWQKEQQEKKICAQLKSESVHRTVMKKAKNWQTDEVDRVFDRVHAAVPSAKQEQQRSNLSRDGGSSPADHERSAATAGAGSQQTEASRKPSNGQLSPRSRQPSQTKVTEPRSAGARAVSARRSRPGASASEEELEEASRVLRSGSVSARQPTEPKTSEPGRRSKSKGPFSMTHLVEEGARQSLTTAAPDAVGAAGRASSVGSATAR